MHSGLEIPPRPPGRRCRRCHRRTPIEPPVIPVDPLWEYREIVCGHDAGLMTTDELNALGAEHWELAGSPRR